MKRKFRLTKSSDFKRVRLNGKSYAHPLIVLVKLPNECAESRFGFTAGRSVGNAVKRNRAKRLMREALRSVHESISAGWDVVLIARRPMVDSNYAQIREIMIDMLQRAGLMREAYNVR